MQPHTHPIGLRLLALMAPLFLAGVAGADPQTMPSQPAPPPDPRAKVLVLPFTAIDAASGDAWLGKSIQQSVVTDLLTGTDHQAAAGDSAASDDVASDAARKAGARYVIFGNIQFSGEDVRVTGQVTDVEAGHTLGGLKATGSVHDLFAMEDHVGAEVKHLLFRAEMPPVEPTGADAPAIVPTGPIRFGDNSSVDPGSNSYPAGAAQQSAAASEFSPAPQQGDPAYGWGAPTYGGGGPNYGWAPSAFGANYGYGFDAAAGWSGGFPYCGYPYSYGGYGLGGGNVVVINGSSVGSAEPASNRRVVSVPIVSGGTGARLGGRVVHPFAAGRGGGVSHGGAARGR